MSEVTDSLLQRLRQLLAQDFKNAANQFTILSDPRYQATSANIEKLVYQNGALLANPIVASGTNALTSTGAVSYTINYGVTFAAAPSVSAWCSQDSGGNVTVLDIVSIGTSSFAVVPIIPGVGVVPSPRTFTVGWVAVGA